METRSLVILMLFCVCGCRTSTPPTIEVCILTGFGSADCVEPDGTKVQKLPSELNNYWSTSESDMERWTQWCYGSSSPSPIKAGMDNIKSRVR